MEDNMLQTVHLYSVLEEVNMLYGGLLARKANSDNLRLEHVSKFCKKLFILCRILQQSYLNKFN